MQDASIVSLAGEARFAERHGNALGAGVDQRRALFARAQNDRARHAVDPADLNFAWNGEGAPTLLPERAFDDGEATFLTWPNGREVPAILVTNSKGVEGPVNYSVRGDTVVIDGVPRSIILRSGEESATLVNTGPERASIPLGETGLARKGDK